MEEFVYHRVPNNMEGTIIYPLNILKNQKPNLYDEYIKKYSQREELLKIKIKPLNCFWNDVIFFSPVHPNEIESELEKAGFSRDIKSRWFKIPLSNLNLENLAVNISKDKFELFKLEMLDKIKFLPQQTKIYYKTCFENNKKPLVLAYAPHLLYKGVLDISKLEIIEI